MRVELVVAGLRLVARLPESEIARILAMAAWERASDVGPEQAKPGAGDSAGF